MKQTIYNSHILDFLKLVGKIYRMFPRKRKTTPRSAKRKNISYSQTGQQTFLILIGINIETHTHMKPLDTLGRLGNCFLSENSAGHCWTRSYPQKLQTNSEQIPPSSQRFCRFLLQATTLGDNFINFRSTVYLNDPGSLKLALNKQDTIPIIIYPYQYLIHIVL